ncbi:ribonuclease J [Candidatus Berkelbacteria bacterium RIFCSPHIGHO2_12_FULL_36_9]|uniref:Ribonuclease J n=1 Tax=Candidatus Berkelbacteria bacterium RIFCSPHIGHO2_12_FULL_36_9 TaxID=1797469 RepID=A0A1F5EFK9_9BACT|nr:MAG: ribonuclease J [Candidatus Berkelbacteria bacterium RIFCSPHIGHO2_12_FULL_36_9]
MPLGGLGEIGKNMSVIEYDDPNSSSHGDIIIIDCGLMFPGGEMLGIDFVIPNIEYLEKNKHKIRGMIITHGHEDHVGAIPYIWPRLSVPIYTGKLTAAMLEARLKEFSIAAPKINILNPGEAIQLGVFKIKPLPLSHTIPDELGLIIETPLGRIAYLADFRFDREDPKEKQLFIDLERIGNEGVYCLFMDSTNAEREGQAISEVKIKDTIETIIAKAKGRVIVTSFASALPRIQSVIDAAAKTNKKVAVFGRSMENAIDIAKRLNYIKAPHGLLIATKQLDHFPKNEQIMLCTGSQGEEYAALVRMAAGEHKQIKIEPGDTVIVSASAVPGNERSIARTIDNLFREGAEVIYGGEAAEVHSTGHAKREDLRLMLKLLRPKHFIPIHGEFRMLVRHAQLASETGVETGNIYVIENGEIVEFNKEGGKISKYKVSSGYILVDGLGVGDVGNIVLRDRQAMAKDGIFVVILTVDHQTGKIVTSPDIISRGFVYMRAREDLIFKARQEIRKMFSHHSEKNPADWEYIKREMRDELGDFLYKETQRRPMVIPVIIEV